MTTTGYVHVGCAARWLAEYDPRARWNGFIAAPAFDALTAVAIFEEIERWNVASNSTEYGYDFEWDGDTLVVTDRQFRDEYPDDFRPERIAPNDDGLYTVGAYGWVWVEADESEQEAV